MKHLLIVLAVVCAGLFFTACESQEPVSPEKEACLNLAKPGCETSAKKACEGKSGYAQTACEKASIEACMAAAGKSC